MLSLDTLKLLMQCIVGLIFEHDNLMVAQHSV